jgi:8-oxo-dGTP pyrophosphatase MutT (NUDIX family)
MTVPNDNAAYRFPVSVKGVILREGAVVLLKNDRDEWELPGGKLELSESPEECVVREIGEELRLTIEPRQLIDSWVYTIIPGVDVLILTYGCGESSFSTAVHSGEHRALRWVPLNDLDDLPMPDRYRTSIRRWAAHSSLG